MQQILEPRLFQKKVWRYFTQHGRTLPWRKTSNPYRILVSEIMLQQTQVDRVIPKYRAWCKRFPTIRALADAPRSEVLTMWQGLGYNRRALALHRTAQMIIQQKKFPHNYDTLISLPGIGPYTACAILAFAFNQPVVLIETNIRSVFIHHFFADQKNVHDRDILPIIEKTLDRRRPREWYWALMDYGAALKKTAGNASRRSAHYTKQSRFAGSDRQLRGQIVRYVGSQAASITNLKQHLTEAQIAATDSRLKKILNDLTSEGFLARRGKKITLAL